MAGNTDLTHLMAALKLDRRRPLEVCMEAGRGVISADGALSATVTIIDDGKIEVAIGRDRYRLPANTGGTK